MSRPKDQSCDNCKYRTEEDTCIKWLDECPHDKGELGDNDYDVRWCQCWRKKND